jgi:hypothetical protein
MFLKSIKFNKAYSDKLTRCYEPVNPKHPQGRARRRVMFICLGEEKEGVIVGKTSRYDGVYVPGTMLGPDTDPPHFKSEKRYDLWRVFTAMNEEYLVPVKEPERERVVAPERVEAFVDDHTWRTLLADVDLD